MVEKPLYEAAVTDGSYPSLAAAITKHGRRRAEYNQERYGLAPEDYGQTQVEVDSWARGPLLRVEEVDSNGETKPPTIGANIVHVIVSEGFVPWGFRPESEPMGSNGFQRSGRFLWYLHPLDGVEDTYEEKYAITDEDDSFVRSDVGRPITFDSYEEASEMAATSTDLSAVTIIE